MSRKPLKERCLPKFRQLLSFLSLTVGHTLYGMPAGNPAEPLLPFTETNSCRVIHFCPEDNPFAIVGGSLRFGFSGDYIFSESASVRGVPVVTSVTTTSGNLAPSVPTITSTTKNFNYDVLNCSVSSSSIFGTLTVQDLSTATFPLLDIALTAKIGGLATNYRLPLNAYRDYTRTPLASESEVTNGTVEVRSNYGVVVDVGAKKILWKDGVSLLGAGIDYRKSSCPVNYIIVQDKANPEIYFDEVSGDIKYQEWAFNIGLTTYYNDCISPYASISVGNTTWEAPTKSFVALEREFTNFFFKTRNLKNYHRINLCGGVTYFAAEKTYVNIEARWGYQRACNISAGIFY